MLIISSLGAGGAERVLSRLANHWVSCGHTVSLITLTGKNIVPFYPLDPRVNLVKLGKTIPGFVSLTRMISLIQCIVGIRRSIKKYTPDMMVSFMDLTNLLTLLITIDKKIPVIISERIDPKFRPLPKIFVWLRQWLYPYAKSLVVQTQSVANYFPKKIAHLITIIENPVYPASIICNTPKKEVKHIVSIGRLDPQKDQKTLIIAFSRIARQFPKITLTIYGEGPLRSELEELIQTLGMKERIYLPGTKKDIENILANSDLFIFPSLYEGFSNALCEAMSIGLPVIASDGSGNRDIVSDQIDGYIFPAGNVDKLVAMMKELICDHSKRCYLATNAKEISTRFAPDIIWARWDKVLNQCVKLSKNI